MLGFGMKSAAKQRANELNVSCFVERVNFDALPQHFKTIVTIRRQDAAQPLEQLLPQLIEAVTLACEPVVEQGGPVDGEALEKVATEQCSQRLKLPGRSARQGHLRTARN
jgi:hypothetical protein